MLPLLSHRSRALKGLRPWQIYCCPTNSRLYTSNPTPSLSTAATHFGFRQVPESDKETLVGQVFEQVSSQYDLMNDLMSLGVHRCWKDTLIRRLDPRPDTKLLDVAGGTGDVAFRFLKAAMASNGDSTQRLGASVKVVDINPAMLQVGQQRLLAQISDSELRKLIAWEVGNAEHLDSIPSDSIDAYTIAFGIRNCTHVDAVLQEAHRVLKRGGLFLCLEFSHVDNALLRLFYDMYSFQIIPALGRLVSNNRDAYQYLVESIRKFPAQREFAHMIHVAGFRQVGYENLSGGIAAIHSGIKL